MVQLTWLGRRTLWVRHGAHRDSAGGIDIHPQGAQLDRRPSCYPLLYARQQFFSTVSARAMDSASEGDVSVGMMTAEPTGVETRVYQLR